MPNIHQALILGAALALAACTTDSNEEMAAATPTPPPCPSQAELVAVNCVSQVTSDLVLDGQLMSCPNGMVITADLTLTGGSQLLSSSRMTVHQGGSINALGEAGCPVRISSSESSPQPGDWTGLDIRPDAGTSSQFSHAIIEYGGESGAAAIEVSNNAAVAFDNVTVRHMRADGMNLIRGNLLEFRAVNFSNIPGVPVTIHPESAHVVTPDIQIDAASVGVAAVATKDIGVSSNFGTGVTWEDIGVPYRIDHWAWIAGTLTITEGAEIWFAPGASLVARDNAHLRVLGTQQNPVTFRSDQATGRPGDWVAIQIYTAAQNLIDHAIVQHGGGQDFGALFLGGANVNLSLSNSQFSNNQSCDIRVDGNFGDSNNSYVPC